MFNSEFGGQIAWLLPSVLVLGAGLLWLGRRAPRTDGVRASVIVWGSWVLVTGLVFSFMAGIIHPYYAVALAPGIAGLAGLGGALLWQHRAQLVAAVALAVAVAAAGFLAFDLLGSTTAYGPWLRWAVLLGALAAAAGLMLSGRFPSRILQRTTAALALAASLAGPLAYSISTASVTHSGAIPSAGPTTTFGGFGFGGRGGFGQNGASQNTGQNNAAQNTPPQALQQPGTQGGGFGANRQGGGMGGLLGATTPSSEMVAALKTGASNYTWAAAVVGSNNAAGYQLATELPVMAFGGFNGTAPPLHRRISGDSSHRARSNTSSPAE
jgi:hypothetical protein